MVVLGVDPGFAAFGLAAVEVVPNGERVLDVRVLRTEEGARASRVKASEDHVRRARELAAALEHAIAELAPVALAVEEVWWPPNVVVSAKLGMAWGLLVAAAERHGLPVLQASAEDVTRAACGSTTASKADVVEALRRRFPSVSWPAPATVAEHAADAVAAVLACRDSPLLVALQVDAASGRRAR